MIGNAREPRVHVGAAEVFVIDIIDPVLAAHPDVTAMEERTCLEDAAVAFFGANSDLDRLAMLSGVSATWVGDII